MIKNEIKSDIIAGFSVFLLALPLCLGIAIGSGFPPIAGIFTAIIGGMLASCCGSSSLTIKGPAAGLIAIVLAAVQELGQGDMMVGYKLTLAVGVVAALLQIIIALCKRATIAEIMPPSVIHGMLAAIGVIIISKQIYVLAGVAPTVQKPFSLLYAFPEASFGAYLPTLLIGLFSFLLVILWPKLRLKVPSSFVIMALVIPISLYLELPQKYLINLPKNFFDGVQFPDFSQVFSPVSIKYIIMFTLVGSIESLLTVCAVDSIRSDMPSSDLNRDLRATGIANLASALIGGMPMISEIVRSKANIDYGAKTARSNFFHGFFMLVAVVLFPSVMNLIPLSALAALLIFVGLRLASPSEFTHAYEVGKDQFILFMTTFIVTLLTDLLIGVIVGVLLKIVLLLLHGNSIKDLIFPTFTEEPKGDDVILAIDGPLTFISYIRFKKTILRLAKEYKKVIISLHAVTYLDHTVIKKLHHFKDVEISIEENQQLARLYSHPFSTRKVT